MANTKEIKLLQKQMDKLDSEDFDLGAWKSSSIILLERLFGSDNQKIMQLEKVRYEQSSWALREAQGSKNLMENCKTQGREILQMAIDELENFGLSKEVIEAQSAPFKTVIVKALENELKIAQYKEIVRIIGSDKDFTEKQKELIETLDNYGHDCADNILVSILLADETRQNI